MIGGFLTSRPGIIPDPILFLVVVPYFFLIHLGMLTFLVSLVAMAKKRKFSFHITWLKGVTTIYGAGVGLLMPFIDKLYAGSDAPTLAYFANIPAALATANIEPYEGLKVYAAYLLFGLMGGWGLGQAIEWFISMLKKKKHENGREPFQTV